MGEIYVIGLGPGGRKQMTIEAYETLKACDAIIGYTVYIDLVRDIFPEKEFLSTPMRQEKERCRMAFMEARKGKTVAMVCSGDPGVYGMAGLMFEIGVEYPEIPVKVLAGVTAATGGAAVLGAPLMHDFALISLSDLLTPWEKIEKRLIAAAEADFVICLYNPSSKKRADYLKRACALVRQGRDQDVVCGVVRNIGREGESMEIMPLSRLSETQVDMFTTVWIGSSQTREIGGRMVTPRGYHIEE